MDFYIILWILLLSFAINFLFFIGALLFKIKGLNDIAYCVSFIILSIIVVGWKQNFSPVQICLLVLYNVWAVRLGIYFLVAIIKQHTNYHFAKISNTFWKFSIYWILQAVSIFIISIPTLFALSLDVSYFNNVFSNYLIIFITFAILFLIIETIADWQKFSFSLKNQKYLLFINYGLWKDCRHPNFLGEIGFWYMISGLFLCDFLLKNISNDLNYLLVLLFLLSPLYLNIMLIKITGVPVLEVSAWQKLSNNLDYQQYLTKTSCVVCYIGKKGPINKVKKIIKT